MRAHSLFLAANLMAAFGGGTILARGIGVLKGTDFQEGSLLAFLVGTVVGLAFYRLIPSRFAAPVSQWFSVAGAASSAGLLLLYLSFANADNGRLAPGAVAMAFFALLVVRFAFWFYSRVMRASRAADEEHGIAWVELGYYGGAAVGLLVWGLIATKVDITVALGVDITLQVLAGGLDLLAYRLLKPTVTPTVTDQQDNISATPEKKQLSQLTVASLSESTRRCWTLVLAVALLTIGTQVVLFDLAHHTREDYAPYVLACFYLGVAIAAYFCKRMAISLWWEQPTAEGGVGGTRKTIGFVVVGTVGLLVVLAVVNGRFLVAALDASTSGVSAETAGSVTVGPPVEGWIVAMLLLGVAIAAYVYETAALAMFERIGEECRRHGLSGWVIRGYAAMAVGAAVSLLLLRLSDNPMVSLSAVAVGCWSCTLFALRHAGVSWRFAHHKKPGQVK